MEKSTVSLRQEFLHLARQDGANVRSLCRHVGISAKTGCKWLARFDHAPADMRALHDRSRRPLSSPARSSAATEHAVLTLRGQHPAWSRRKIARRLSKLRLAQLAPSTVTHILHRLPIGIRADGLHDVSFCHQRFMQIDLRALSADA
ncbi:MAG: helix-turn-helix domain-containing protein [Pseudomonadota bacterium]|nr:helix-turn-helix domain-containing protein [Pseudomonadota bacterium]